MKRGKRKEKAARGGGGQSVVTPVSFKLHTELLAERRKQQRDEKELAQLLHVQQKIVGKKTVEDFARMKLIRRQMAGTSSRSLHCNGKQINAAASCKEPEVLKERSPESNVHLESRLLQSARGPYSRQVSDSLPKRPQSAKPVLQTYYDSIDAHKVTSPHDEKRAAMRDGKQSSAHPVKKKKKRRSVDRASGRLTPSKSAPVLPNETDRSQHSPTCKKINIIVNMRSLQLAEEDESPDEAAPPPRQAWGD